MSYNVCKIPVLSHQWLTILCFSIAVSTPAFLCRWFHVSHFHPCIFDCVTDSCLADSVDPNWPRFRNTFVVSAAWSPTDKFKIIIFSHFFSKWNYLHDLFYQLFPFVITSFCLFTFFILIIFAILFLNFSRFKLAWVGCSRILSICLPPALLILNLIFVIMFLGVSFKPVWSQLASLQILCFNVSVVMPLTYT